MATEQLIQNGDRARELEQLSSKRYVTAPQQGFLSSKYADLVVTWSLPLSNKRHFKMAVCLHCGKIWWLQLPVHPSCTTFSLTPCMIITKHRWIVPRASVSPSLCQNKRQYIEVTRSLTARVALRHILLNLTQIWENISHIYCTTGALPHNTIHSHVSLSHYTLREGMYPLQQSPICFTALFHTTKTPHPLHQ